MKQSGLLLFAILSGAYGAISGDFIGLLLGGLLVLVAFSGLVKTATQQDLAPLDQFIKPWSLLLSAALVCSGVAAWLAKQDIFSRSSGYIWLGALLLTILAGILHDRQRKPALLKAQAETTERHEPKGNKQPWNHWDWLAVIGLTGLALGLRLYRLDGFLPTLHGDEGEMGLLALLALHGPASGLSPNPLPFFGTGFLDHPTLFHYVQAGAMLLFGESETGLRILSAIFGALCTPLIYAIGRRGWGRVAGLTAGWLLAVSNLHIHYSRIALNNIETVWFTILFILLFGLLYEYGQHKPFSSVDFTTASPPSLLLAIGLGLTIGISQYFYYGSRLLPILTIPFLLYLWWTKRISRVQFIGLAVATAVAYLPLLTFYYENWPAFINRTRGVTILNPQGLTYILGPKAVWPRDIPLLLWEQSQRTFKFFIRDGDRSAFYLADIPAFDQLTVLFFWLGLGIILVRIHRFPEFMAMVWFGLGVLLSSILTNDAPNGPRLIVAVPAVYLIGGVFVQEMHNFWTNAGPPTAKWVPWGLGGALAVLILCLNFLAYFVTYAHISPNLTVISIAHEIADNHTQFRAFLLGDPELSVNYGTLRFVARDADKYDVTAVDQVQPLVAGKAAAQGLLFIALPNHLTELAEIEQLYPNGAENTHRNSLGDLLYLTYRIPAEQK
ncbi:MAG: glycosyltransferase family 39 protein [Caldilineaceae bacterium]